MLVTNKTGNRAPGRLLRFVYAAQSGIKVKVSLNIFIYSSKLRHVV